MVCSLFVRCALVELESRSGHRAVCLLHMANQEYKNLLTIISCCLTDGDVAVAVDMVSQWATVVCCILHLLSETRHLKFIDYWHCMALAEEIDVEIINTNSCLFCFVQKT